MAQVQVASAWFSSAPRFTFRKRLMRFMPAASAAGPPSLPRFMTIFAELSLATFRRTPSHAALAVFLSIALLCPAATNPPPQGLGVDVFQSSADLKESLQPKPTLHFESSPA